MQEVEEYDDDTLIKCPGCGNKILLCDCIMESNIVAKDIEIVKCLCPKCGAVMFEEEYDPDLGVGPDYGDYDPNHAGWDSGDYGDYGGE